MDIYAKQIAGLDVHKMDITTALSFFTQIKGVIAPNMALQATLSGVWQTFVARLADYDTAYAQARKWAQTEDIDTLDKERDHSLAAFLSALKAMAASPNQTKRQAARLLTFIRDKYSIAASDEYMKETTVIQQMTHEMEATDESRAAIVAAGLDDWLEDLKQKNEAFLVKMNERTDAQAGLQKGIVREARLKVEAAYRNLVKAINALSIVQVPEGFDYATVIDRLNAEVEHYRQILARKGVVSGSSSGGGGSDDQGGGGSDQGGGGDVLPPDGGSDDQGGGGGGSDDQGGGGDVLPPDGGGEL